MQWRRTATKTGNVLLAMPGKKVHVSEASRGRVLAGQWACSSALWQPNAPRTDCTGGGGGGGGGASAEAALSQAHSMSTSPGLCVSCSVGPNFRDRPGLRRRKLPVEPAEGDGGTGRVLLKRGGVQRGWVGGAVGGTPPSGDPELLEAPKKFLA